MDFSVFRNKYKIEGKLIVKTALHIGSGREEGEHDAPFIKDYNGNFYIPGSSFRGYLRAKLERFLLDLNGFKFKDKDTGDPLNMADIGLIFGYTNLNKEKSLNLLPDYDEKDPKQEEAMKKIKERIAKKLEFDLDKELENFSSIAGKIHIADMPVISDIKSIRRDGIKIDRDSGTVATGAKFDYDIVPAGTEFKFEIELENIEAYQLDLVALALKDISSEDGDLFGGKLSRGIGLCQVEIEKIEYIDKENIKDYIFKKKMLPMKKENFEKLEHLDIE